MANNKFAIKMRKALDDEFQKGFTAALALVLPAYYNTADEFVKEEEQPIFFMKMEEELNRIIHDELKDNILDAAELTAFKIEEIRKKWGMVTYENE